jgi:hypothetical protein
VLIMKDRPAAQTRALLCPNASTYDTIVKWSCDAPRLDHDHDSRIDSEDHGRRRKRDQMACGVRHLAGLVADTCRVHCRCQFCSRNLSRHQR